MLCMPHVNLLLNDVFKSHVLMMNVHNAEGGGGRERNRSGSDLRESDISVNSTCRHWRFPWFVEP